MKRQIELMVNDYFNELHLQASESKEDFWRELHLWHGELAGKFKAAFTDQVGNRYSIKNQILQFGLDVAKWLADYYKQYCKWFVSLKESAPKRLLDIGCDNGILTCFYAYLYPETEVIGIDPCKEGIQCAKELAERLGLTNVSFEQLSYQELECYPKAHFDMITSVRVFHEIIGTIKVPEYWSLAEIIEEQPLTVSPAYLVSIEYLLSDEGKYIHAERLQNQAALAQWSNTLKGANLHLQWDMCNFNEYREFGTPHKEPLLIASKSDSGLSTMEGMRILYTSGIQLEPRYNTTFSSISADMLFEQLDAQELLMGSFIPFKNHWYKMRFEMWKTANYIVVYVCGNMGHKKLNIFPLECIDEANEKRKEYIQQFANRGEVFEYSSLAERKFMENMNTIKQVTYIKNGYIDADDDVMFKRIYEACNIFGHNYKGFQRGGAKHPYRNDVIIWFPKLNTDGDWINTISNDEEYIFERPADTNLVQEHMNHHISSDIHKRIVFAYEKDNNGQFMYRFKGEYEIDVQQSYKQKCLVWKRIAKRVKTYPPKN